MKWLRIDSIVIGILTCLSFIYLPFPIPEFKQVFRDLCVTLPRTTKFMISTLPTAWPLLGVLVLIFIIGKDYWLKWKKKETLTSVNITCTIFILLLFIIVRAIMFWVLFSPLLIWESNLG